MKIILKNAIMISAFISAIFLGGCSGDDDDDAVTAPVAGFTFQINEETGAVTFTNTSTGDDVSYSWDFGDGTNSVEINPVKTYASGIYTVVLTATNDGGSDTEEASLTIETSACTEETEESLLAADLNMTFMTDPESSITIVSDNAGYARIDNPDFENDVNSSCFVAEISRDGASAFANNQFNLDAKLNFNTNGGIKMKVWSAVAGYSVTVKLEDQANAATNTELTVASTKTSAWEELTFTFEGEDNKYDKIVLFFDLNTNTTDTYYFDDLALFVGDGTGQTCESETTESLAAADLNLTFMTDPETALSIVSDNAGYARIDNPDSENDINNSCYVAEISRDGASAFSNNQFTLDAKLNFNTNGGFKMKTWSAAAGTTVTLKLEDNANAGINTEQTVTLTKTSEWEELTFTFENGDDKYDKIVLFFDLNTNNTATYYFDDLAIYQGDGTGGGGGNAAPTAAAPAPTRAAADVISLFSDVYTDVTVDTWRTDWSSADFEDVMIAGNATKKYSNLDFVGIETVANKVDASSMTHIHVDVWSADFTQFSLKLVNFADAGNSEHQVDYMNPNQGEWIGYDIPLSNFTGLNATNEIAQYIFVGRPISANTIFLDNIYFYDDGTTGGGGGGGSGSGTELTTNGDFETGDLTGWTSFATDNNGTFEATTAQANGGTFSGLLVADVDGGNGGASFPVVKQANIGVGTIAPNTAVTVKMDVFGSVAGAGGVVFVEFFSELSGGGTSQAGIIGQPVPDGTWTTHTYQVTTGSDVSGGVTLQIKADCGANAGCKVDLYVDNVSVTID